LLQEFHVRVGQLESLLKMGELTLNKLSYLIQPSSETLFVLENIVRGALIKTKAKTDDDAMEQEREEEEHHHETDMDHHGTTEAGIMEQQRKGGNMENTHPLGVVGRKGGDLLNCLETVCVLGLPRLEETRRADDHLGDGGGHYGGGHVQSISSDTFRRVGGFVMQRCSAPFFRMLETWLLRGDLAGDVHGEFMVRRGGNPGNTGTGSNFDDEANDDEVSHLWHSEFQLVPENVPYFLAPLATRILQTGKYLLFL
jgi:hypothetical protein